MKQAAIAAVVSGMIFIYFMSLPYAEWAVNWASKYGLKESSLTIKVLGFVLQPAIALAEKCPPYHHLLEIQYDWLNGDRFDSGSP